MESIITEKMLTKNIEDFSKIIKEDLARIVVLSIKNFAIDYANTNDTPFLIEEIYNTKIAEINQALCKYPELVTDEKQAEEIVLKSPAELNPLNFESLLKKKEIEEYKKNNVKSSSAFNCSKCKKSKCSVTQKQIRAGDEPATTFVTCLECGHSFSFN